MQISVVIPLYNKVETIDRALQSVFAQTVQPVEIIVVNDGSTDGSEQKVAQISHPLIRLIHQKNAGVSAARNKGIELAKGDWIAFLDADDEWKPAFLDTMQMLANTYPQCKVVASAYEMQDQTGKRKSIILNRIPFAGDNGILSNYFEVASNSHPPLWSSAIFIFKETIKKIGGFPVGIKAGEDLITWSKLSRITQIAYSRRPNAIYFLETDIKSRNYRWKTLLENNKKVIAELGKILKLSSKYERFYLAEWYKINAMQYLSLNLKILALNSIFRSITLRPFRMKIYLYFILLFLPNKYILKIKAK